MVKQAEGFCAKGLLITSTDQIGTQFRKAFELPGPILIAIRGRSLEVHMACEGNSRESGEVAGRSPLRFAQKSALTPPTA